MSQWKSMKAARLVDDAVSACIRDPLKIRRLINAMRIFAECDLHDGNCASLEVATRRIRKLADNALNDLLDGDKEQAK